MQRENWWAIAALLVLVGTPARGEDLPPPWPPFLPPPSSFSPEVTAAVMRVWDDPTLRRTVRGRTARAPFDMYAAFVDAPEVTAAAARFRRLANYEVQALDDGRHQADDGDGARGFYRVLVREGGRRVILSWGEHSGVFLGTVHGSALTVLALEPRDGGVDQGLTADVRIDNRFAAVLAGVLIELFGALADRKLMEGFEVTAEVAEWAVERTDEFCLWLRSQPLAPERREPILRALPAWRSLPGRAS